MNRWNDIESLKVRLLKGMTIDANGCWISGVARKGVGYARIPVDGKRTLAHRVSYAVFNGVPMPSLYVLHSCDVPLCINPAHLFVGTQLDNMRDCVAKGRPARGEAHGKAKLSEHNVRTIRDLARDGTKQDLLAELFGVGQQNINSIVRRVTWRHVA